MYAFLRVRLLSVLTLFFFIVYGLHAFFSDLEVPQSAIFRILPDWGKFHHTGKASIQFSPVRNVYLMFVVDKVHYLLGVLGIHFE